MFKFRKKMSRKKVKTNLYLQNQSQIAENICRHREKNELPTKSENYTVYLISNMNNKGRCPLKFLCSIKLPFKNEE